MAIGEFFSTSVGFTLLLGPMSETKLALKARASRVAALLEKHYPDAHCALEHRNALELLVATILSAQCTDVRVNIVTRDLFKTFPLAKDFAAADPEGLAQAVKPTGFYRTKAKNLKSVGEILVRDHGGEVPPDLDALVSLPGVGRKTANVVLGDAFGLALGIVVDTHVKRVAYRLGLTQEITPEKVEQDLLELIPKKDWVQISHQLIFHGRQVCKARRPLCKICPLAEDCPRRGVKLTTPVKKAKMPHAAVNSRKR